MRMTAVRTRPMSCAMTTNGEVEVPPRGAHQAPRAHTVFPRPRRVTASRSRSPPTIVSCHPNRPVRDSICLCYLYQPSLGTPRAALFVEGLRRNRKCPRASMNSWRCFARGGSVRRPAPLRDRNQSLQWRPGISSVDSEPDHVPDGPLRRQRTMLTPSHIRARRRGDVPFPLGRYPFLNELPQLSSRHPGKCQHRPKTQGNSSLLRRTARYGTCGPRWQLTVKLRGRPEGPIKRRGRTLSSHARGA